ncbi:MAG: hypothetical protein WAO69_03415 [Aestuariivita sp.]|uniref:hypothetical protein n=1 Tax=Aestuariivita sp. TaxID=1872407 RepID=UPI003BAE8BB1
MTKYAPTKGDLQFHLGFSLVGLALMCAGVFYRGLPSRPAMFEVIGVSTLFLGGTAIWTMRKLKKGEYSDGL